MDSFWMKQLNYLLIAVCSLVIVINAVVFFSGVPIDRASTDNFDKADKISINDSKMLHARNEIERLKDAVTAMEGRLNRAEALISELHIEMADSAQKPGDHFEQAEPQPKKTLTTAQIEQSNRQQREQASVKLAEYFQTEAADSAWSPKITGLIQDSFLNTEKLADVRLINGDCRATLCRIEVLVDNPEQILQFETELPALIGEELPRMTTFTEEQGNGSSRVTVYLARKGYKLP